MWSAHRSPVNGVAKLAGGRKLCKDFWMEVYRKQVDKLQTNNRGVYMLQDNAHPVLARCSPSAARQSSAKQMAALESNHALSVEAHEAAAHGAHEAAHHGSIFFGHHGSAESAILGGSIAGRMMVADGAGGHPKGEEASKKALESIRDEIVNAEKSKNKDKKFII